MVVVGGWWINPLQPLPQGLVLTFDFDFDPDPELYNFIKTSLDVSILNGNISTQIRMSIKVFMRKKVLFSDISPVFHQLNAFWES